MEPQGYRRGVRAPKTQYQRPKSLKRKRENEDLDALSQQVVDLDAKSSAPPENFVDIPLSQATQSGLSASHFKTTTTIQSRTIPLALQRTDILGAAKDRLRKDTGIFGARAGKSIPQEMDQLRWRRSPHTVPYSRIGNPDFRCPAQSRSQPHLLRRLGHWREESTRRKGTTGSHEHTNRNTGKDAATFGSNRGAGHRQSTNAGSGRGGQDHGYGV